MIAWKDGKQQILTARNGLPCNVIYSLIADNDGALWLYTQRGIVKIPKTELQKWWLDSNNILQLQTIDSVDGAQPALVPFEGAARSSDGKLWFANWTALQVIDPANMTRNLIPPPVYIEDIIAEHKNYDATKNVSLPANTQDLQIDYAALSFTNPQKVTFRYKLEGTRNNTWEDVGTRRQGFYTNLSPGHYRFHVIASNNDGVWNETGATLDFRVPPAWYQTVWFRSFCVVAFVLFLWALHQLRLRQLARQFNMRMEERIGERTRIARELHDTLLQNLHAAMFQFQAASNMVQKRPEDAKQTLDSAINETEEAIAESEDAIRDLRSEQMSETDLAQLLTEVANELASSQDADHSPPGFRVIVEGEQRNLLSSVQDEVYRIAREALRNAFQHASAHQIEAEIRYDDHAFRLRIRDDGKGIDPEVLKEGRLAGHWGLPGIKERAQRIGAKLDVWSEGGAGTEIQLTVPAALGYEPVHNRSRFRILRRAKS